MTSPNWPYKPELNAKKAKLFARCLMHCLYCEEFGEVTEEEQKYILNFCNVVEGKDFIEQSLKQINDLKSQKAAAGWNEIQAYVEKQKEQDAPSSME